MQASGTRDSWLRTIPQADVRRLAEINVGPWDRLDDNAPFVPGVSAKPAGANFYPRDMSKEEFEREAAAGGARGDSLKSLYTMIRRGTGGRPPPDPHPPQFSPPQQRAPAQQREA